VILDFFLSGLWNFIRAVLLIVTWPSKFIGLLFALVAFRAATHGQFFMLIVAVVIGALLFAIRDWIRYSRWN
jgi:hypothetical protein